MATYYSSSNNQRDAAAATMLYLRENLPSSYSETPVLPSGNMMMYMNYASSSSGSYSDALAANSQQQNSNSFLGSAEHQQEIGGDHDFNAWRDGRNEMLLMHQNQLAGPTNILHGGQQNLQGQGLLSLSLGTQIPSGMQIPPIQFRNPNLGFSSFRDDDDDKQQSRNGECLPIGFSGGNQESVQAAASDPSSYGISSVARTVPNSKYLKAAQQLLDEVVNVRKSLKQPDSEKNQNKHEHWAKDDDGGSKKNEDPLNHQDSTANSSSEISHAERLELQNKMTKLLSMMDEVDRRYKQYYHQMQIVVSSFDVIAGCGAAKPYTALALQTISRHFRCLRDGITGQIRETRKSLGEQDTSANSSKGIGISRLRYVDQQLRQQRALQQLGMMQQHTWRPQRGLPESSVSILRAWLFEHFLHPYPKDSDKIMLARQTGLTRSQVSNWFINARVRLWKPMVEEMYKEEAGGEVEMDSNSSSENAPKSRKGVIRASEDRGEDLQHQSATSTATERCSTGQFIDSFSKPNHLPDVEMAGPPPGETETDYGILKFRGEQRPTSIDDCSLFRSGIVQSDHPGDRFMAAAAAAYHMSELERFGNGNGGVSLTLGLQHCEAAAGGIYSPTVGTHNGFVTMRGGDIYNPAASSVGPETADFDCIDPGNRQQQHRFSSSSHLLHDFVA